MRVVFAGDTRNLKFMRLIEAVVRSSGEISVYADVSSFFCIKMEEKHLSTRFNIGKYKQDLSAPVKIWNFVPKKLTAYREYVITRLYHPY